MLLWSSVLQQIERVVCPGSQRRSNEDVPRSGNLTQLDSRLSAVDTSQFLLNLCQRWDNMLRWMPQNINKEILPSAPCASGFVEKHYGDQREQLPTSAFGDLVSLLFASVPLAQPPSETLSLSPTKKSRTTLQHGDALQKYLLDIDLVQLHPTIAKPMKNGLGRVRP